jgi:hypothetical protein
MFTKELLSNPGEYVSTWSLAFKFDIAQWEVETPDFCQRGLVTNVASNLTFICFGTSFLCVRLDLSNTYTFLCPCLKTRILLEHLFPVPVHLPVGRHVPLVLFPVRLQQPRRLVSSWAWVHRQ